MLLSRAAQIVRDAGYVVGNVDLVVIAQQPKIVPYIDAIRANLARAMRIVPEQVNVKGKTNEGVDSMGQGSSIAVHAVALLSRASSSLTEGPGA
jgi:2-C-methyl-D-erythritol 2,4-cyclodiphosphate synthase